MYHVKDVHHKFVRAVNGKHIVAVTSSSLVMSSLSNIVSQGPPVPTIVQVPEASQKSAKRTVAPRNALDELQAQHTALCFLCAIQASPGTVRAFLKQFPHVMLMEGTTLLPEESAQHVLHQSATCISYRNQILPLLRKDFAYYHQQRLQSSNPNVFHWQLHSNKVSTLEHNIRLWRLEEISMRTKIMEVSCQVQSLREQLQDAAARLIPSQSSLSSLWACTVKPSHNVAADASWSRRAALEYEHGVVAIELAGLQRHHQNLLREIRQARQAQFHVLKQLFAPVARHECRDCRVSTQPPTTSL
jgi:hypothetical protein